MVDFTKKLPKSMKVVTGDSLVLKVTVTSPDDVTLEWRRNNEVVRSGKGSDFLTFNVTEAKAEHAGTYTVKGWRGTPDKKSDEAEGGSCIVEVTNEEKEPPPQQTAEWDPKFAKTIVHAAVGAGAALLIIIVGLAFVKGTIAWTVSVGLLTIAAVLSAGGVAVALIDLRGRARAVALANNAAKGLGADAVKASADILKAWGALGLASALLALAAIAMISATALGWRSLPDTSSTPTPTPTPTVTPSPVSDTPTASPSPQPDPTPTAP